MCTIAVASAHQSQLSPVSAVISVGGDSDSKHDISDDVIDEEEPSAPLDEEDTITPLPSDMLSDSGDDTEGTADKVSTAIPLANHRLELSDASNYMFY